MPSKKQLVEEIAKAYRDIAEFTAKNGTTQGEREENKELFWYGDEKVQGHGSNSDFIITNITRSELIFTKIVKTLRELNRTAFGSGWGGDSATKALVDRLEDRLFNGQVAIFKHPITGNAIAESCTWQPDWVNAETNLPSKIKIVSRTESINGLELTEFALGFNSSTRTAELAYDMADMELMVNATMSLALAIRKGKPKTFIAGMDDDTLAEEIRRAVESDSWIEYLNISAKQLQQLDIRFDTGFKDKMEMVISTTQNFMKWKGWNTNGLILKRERQSEQELGNQDEFKHYLIENKIVEREYLAEQCKKIGISITYDGSELLSEIKGETECTDQVDKKVPEQE